MLLLFMITISKHETVKTANPFYEDIDSKEYRLRIVDQQQENPSYGEKYIVYVSKFTE